MATVALAARTGERKKRLVTSVPIRIFAVVSAIAASVVGRLLEEHRPRLIRLDHRVRVPQDVETELLGLPTARTAAGTAGVGTGTRRTAVRPPGSHQPPARRERSDPLALRSMSPRGRRIPRSAQTLGDDEADSDARSPKLNTPVAELLISDRSLPTARAEGRSVVPSTRGAVRGEHRWHRAPADHALRPHARPRVPWADASPDGKEIIAVTTQGLLFTVQPDGSGLKVIRLGDVHGEARRVGRGPSHERADVG